jgi:hypothetical protein
MENRNGVVILPEGNHATFRKLRQLKKGICRIAFQTAEAKGFTGEINIVPVGLDYSHYWRFRQVLTVVYGHPIRVSDYYESYRENPNRAISELRDRLSDELKKVMVHIDDEENYEAINELRNIINEKYSDSIKYPKLFRDKRLVSKLSELRVTDPERYGKICEQTLAVRTQATELNVTYRHLKKKKHPAPFHAACLHSRRRFQYRHLPACLSEGHQVKGPCLHKHGTIRILPWAELSLRTHLSPPCPDFRQAVVACNNGLHGNPLAGNTGLELVSASAAYSGRFQDMEPEAHRKPSLQ